jgi:hypothetical protein
MSTDMAWAGDALCAEVGGDIHFPEKGEQRREERSRRAREARAA